MFFLGGRGGASVDSALCDFRHRVAVVLDGRGGITLDRCVDQRWGRCVGTVRYILERGRRERHLPENTWK